MMELVSATKEMNEQINELTKLLATMCVDQLSFITTNDDDVKAFSMMFRLMGQAQRVQLEQAKAIEEINEKLDMLLAK